MATNVGGWTAQRIVAATGLVAVLLLASNAANAQVCVGDCNDDRFVFVNELVTGVNIALDRASIDACPSFDVGGNENVEVNELILAVNNALRGCPAIPASPTPSNTTGPTNTPLATSTFTATATATLIVTVGTATPTGTVEEATPTVTVTVGTATPTGTVEETPTPTFTMVVGTATPTGTFEEATPTMTVDVGTATPTGTVTEGTPTATSVSAGTPTATSTPTASPLPTQTPIIDTVAGVSGVIGNAVTALPNMVSSLINAIQLTGGGFGAPAGGAAGGPDQCELAGTVSKTGNLLQGLVVSLDECEVSRPGGSTVFDTIPGGTVTVQTNISGVGTATINAIITFKNTQGDPTLITDADLTAGIAAQLRAPQAGEPCDFDLSVLGKRVVGGVNMTLNGTLQSTGPGGAGVVVTFQNTTANLTINTYSADCVPSDYVLVLNGAAQIAQTSGSGTGAGDAGVSFDVLFDDFTIDGEVAGSATSVAYSGTITAICFGGSATLSTPERVQLLLGEFCPQAGRIVIQDVGQIFYSDGGLSIDTDNNGTPDDTYGSCIDPALLQCIG